MVQTRTGDLRSTDGEYGAESIGWGHYASCWCIHDCEAIEQSIPGAPRTLRKRMTGVVHQVISSSHQNTFSKRAEGFGNERP